MFKTWLHYDSGLQRELEEADAVMNTLSLDDDIILWQIEQYQYSLSFLSLSFSLFNSWGQYLAL